MGLAACVTRWEAGWGPVDEWRVDGRSLHVAARYGRNSSHCPAVSLRLFPSSLSLSPLPARRSFHGVTRRTGKSRAERTPAEKGDGRPTRQGV